MNSIDASEHQIQVSLIAQLYYRMRPEIVRFSVPNGGLRNARVQNMLIDEGLLPGMTDLGFALPEARTLWMEVKAKGGSLSDEQKGVRYKLRHLGHEYAMVRSVDEAMEILAKMGALK